MPIVHHLSFRVNGREHTELAFRFSMHRGTPTLQPQVFLQGETNPLTSTDLLELREDGGEWQPVTLPYFITILQTQGDKNIPA